MMQSNQKNNRRAALYFFETDHIEHFKECFEEETSKDPQFQEKLLEFSSSDNDIWQGSEVFIKKAIETNKDYQFNTLKDKLFQRFNKTLSELLEIPTHAEITELKKPSGS